MILFLGAAWLYVAVVSGSLYWPDPVWAGVALVANMVIGLLWLREWRVSREKLSPAAHAASRRGIVLGSAQGNRASTSSRIPEPGRLAAQKRIRTALRKLEK